MTIRQNSVLPGAFHDRFYQFGSYQNHPEHQHTRYRHLCIKNHLYYCRFFLTKHLQQQYRLRLPTTALCHHLVFGLVPLPLLPARLQTLRTDHSNAATMLHRHHSLHSNDGDLLIHVCALTYFSFNYWRKFVYYFWSLHDNIAKNYQWQTWQIDKIFLIFTW